MGAPSATIGTTGYFVDARARAQAKGSRSKG
jgi:hypothetical protein